MYVSSCCGAEVYDHNDGIGICSDCKEWSDVYDDEEEDSE